MVQGLLLTILLLSAQIASAASLCKDFFLKDYPEPAFAVEDHRVQWKRDQPTDGLLLIGFGNSGNVYLYKENAGEFKIAKQYHADRLHLLDRDFKGLLLIKQLFDSDRNHSTQLKVVTPGVIENFKGIDGNRAISTPYVEGINLHKLLISDDYPKSLRLKAAELYQALIQELINDMKSRGIRFEVAPERPIYFIDKTIDGLNLLRIDSEPALLIKTDNLIYNPTDNTLTLVDQF